MADNNLFDPSRLYEVLKKAGLLPKVANFTPSSGEGMFSSDTNRLVSKLPKKTDVLPEASTNTLAHEMTHAVQFNLLRNTAHAIQQKSQSGQELTDKERQYLRAAEKIFADQWTNVGNYDRARLEQDTKAYNQQVRSQYQNSDPRFQQYRTKPEEAQAWGVGNMSTPMNSRTAGANPHLDPSMTTEFDILLSMYQGLPSSIRESAAAGKQQQINENRAVKNDVYLPYAEDLFSDPFKYTIK